MSKKLKTFLISVLVLAVIGYIAGVCLHYFTQNPDSFTDSLGTDYAFVGAGVGAVAGLLYTFASKPKKQEDKKESKGKTASGVEMDLSYDAKWLKAEDISKKFGLISTNLETALKDTVIKLP